MESSARSTSSTRSMFSQYQSPARSPSPSCGLSVRRPSSPSWAGSFSSTTSSSSSSSPFLTKSSGARSSPTAPTRKKKTCMCSPTNHPGSFRCSYHRNLNNNNGHSQGAPSVSAALNMRRSAMVNSIVRIGSVEGNEMIRKALTSLIRPCSHHMRRRDAFNPRPSRLCHMARG